ncbi:malate synthase A [Shewanella pneumatophori]|uniref:malate synthase n=1 Tax=Shewanella pneumatophori TaxID=314092 RepID=A0A9X1ZH14_9GAMM|nr:malate synthase A [Shewanella pneumatophori]MCL1139717.1 malate synthase A [Shewanella pneumatophori]
MTGLLAELSTPERQLPAKAQVTTNLSEELKQPKTIRRAELTELSFVNEPIDGQQELLSDGVKCLLKALCQQFAPEVNSLLKARQLKQQRFSLGEKQDFSTETASIRQGRWQVRAVTEALQDRRVELTGSVAKMSVTDTGIHTDAKAFIVEFTDSQSWQSIIQGHTDLAGIVTRSIGSDTVSDNTELQLEINSAAAITCKVRSLHIKQQQIEFAGEPIPAGLFDFCVYFYNNYRQLLSNGSGPYFYIPKLESHLEARWWAKVFAFVEARFCLQPGSIKCTCGIETIPAMLEMDEILYELRSNIVALSSANLSSILSAAQVDEMQGVKPSSVSRLSANNVSLDAYQRLLIKTCHKRGALALTTVLTDERILVSSDDNVELLSITRELELKARSGFDGVNVNHARLVETAMSVFNRYIGEGNSNQLHITRDVDAPIHAQDLLPAV